MATLRNRIECKKKILRELDIRNKDEKSFEAIVLLSNRLFDSVDSLQRENLKLRIQNERLQQGQLTFQLQGHSFAQSSETLIRELERKIFQLQEELTELHRKNGEFSQQIIDLMNCLDEKDKIYTAKCFEVQDIETRLSLSEEACKMHQHKAFEAEQNRLLIKEEYDALLLIYSSLEGKKQKLEKDHRDLISRWMAFKARDADKLNAETEKLQKFKQEKLQQALEEAAKEPMPPENLKTKIAVCIDAAIPRKLLHKFDAHDGEVNAAVWSPSGSKLVTGGGDRKLKIWEIPIVQPVLKGVAHESNSSVMAVDFDAEENYVLGGSSDFACRVWTVSDMKIRHTLTGHSGKVMSAKFLGQSSKVVSASHDRTLKIWDLHRRACIRTILAGSSCNDAVVRGVSLCTIASGHSDKRIRFWDMRTDSSQNEILLQGKVSSLDFSHDENYLLSCSRDDTLKLIDFRMNGVLRTFSTEGFVVGFDWTRAKFSPDSQFCIAGSQDGSVFIWSVQTGIVKKILKEHSCAVITCSWNPSGRPLITCDRNKKAILWSDL